MSKSLDFCKSRILNLRAEEALNEINTTKEEFLKQTGNYLNWTIRNAFGEVNIKVDFNPEGEFNDILFGDSILDCITKIRQGFSTTPTKNGDLLSYTIGNFITQNNMVYLPIRLEVY